MATSIHWQLAREAAERYEQILVPAILGPAAHALVKWAGLRPGETVVDVGCGTGAATRAAAVQVGPTGRVIGLDVNTAMLAVARSLPSVAGAAIEWSEHSAYQLPLGEQTVDAIVCAQTLQFLDDRSSALAEMHRVLKRGGRVALSVWCAIQASPYFHTLVEVVSRHIGPEVAAGLHAAFRLSKAEDIRTLLTAAGLRSVSMEIWQLDLQLPQLSDFVPRHISATPMAAGFNAAPPAVQQAVVREVAERLAHYTTQTGACIPFSTHLAMGAK